MATVTKRTFVETAEIMRAVRPAGWERTEVHEQWRFTVKAFADEYQGRNERFDRTRFLNACGYPTGEYDATAKPSGSNGD